MTIEEELTVLETKLNQLKRDYEQYFLGTRPREPVMLRGDVQKQFIRHSNVPIQNTAARFRFNSLNSRFQAFRRQWDNVLRQIEAGTYKRHVFRADLHDRNRGLATEAPRPGSPPDEPSLFESYRDAALACGQSVKGLTAEKLSAVIKKQETALREKHGCEKVDFRVVVEAGKVKLKASAAK